MLTWAVDSSKSGSVVIHYVDAQGDHTVREIVPLQLEGEMTAERSFNAEYVHAHCHVARDSRTFRVDRIRELADPRSGEVLDLVRWLNALPMRGQPEGAAPAAPDLAYAAPRRLRWKLIALLFVIGYAIGRFRLIRWALHAAGRKWGLWL